MSMQTDIKSTACAAGTSTTVFNGRSRFRGMVVSYPVAGGTVSVTDGNGGATIFSFTSPAAAGTENIILPAEGILAYNSIYVTCAASTTATVYYS